MTDAIVDSIREAFPVFELVEAYPDDLTSLPTPACVIELVDLEPADDIALPNPDTPA
jgi:hypothetical protein